MKRGTRLFAIAASLLVLTVGAIGLWFFRDVMFYPDRSFAQTRALLLPHVQIMQPGTPGRHPAVIYFHGCGGLHDARAWRAQKAVDQGFVAILVDSYTGRGIDWQRTCSGETLPGFQRAADVFVALDMARKMPSVDATQLFIVGYSHGAWTVLEALSLGDKLPWGLTDSPGHHLDGVRGAVVWYPYCGLAAQYRDTQPPARIPVLMLLAAEDHTTPPQPCIDYARREQHSGYPISWQVYPGVDHGFDLQEDWVRVFDPRIQAQSMAAQMAFLTKWRRRAAP